MVGDNCAIHGVCVTECVCMDVVVCEHHQPTYIVTHCDVMCCATICVMLRVFATTLLMHINNVVGEHHHCITHVQ